MNDFDALLTELAPLAKAMAAPDGDAKIAAAAAEAGATLPDGTAAPADGAGAGGAAGDGEAGDEELMGKSFQVTLADGTIQEAYDGTAMMKAMATEMTALRTESAEHASKLDASQAELAKALQVGTSLVGLVKSQGELIKSLQGDMVRFGATGRGRQANVTVLDKPGAIAAAPAAPDVEAIMAKAMTAHTAGEFTSSDIARLEAHLGRGNPPPADLVARLPA